MERILTEKEKMLLGGFFKTKEKELIEERVIAHGLCAEYNATSELEEERRKDILNCLLGKIGKGVFIQGPIQLDYSCRHMRSLQFSLFFGHFFWKMVQL